MNGQFSQKIIIEESIVIILQIPPSEGKFIHFYSCSWCFLHINSSYLIKDSYLSTLNNYSILLTSKLTGRVVQWVVNTITGRKSDAKCSAITFNLITKFRSESSTVKNPYLAPERQTLDCFTAFTTEVYLLFDQGRINFMQASIWFINLSPTEPWVWHVSFFPSNNWESRRDSHGKCQG